jgi:hypothetical protein
MGTRGSKRIKRSADVDAATPGCLGCADLKTELGQLKTELSELKTELGDYKAVCEANARNLSKLPQLSCRLSEGDPGVLLGALIRELPEVFEAEVLSKLDCKDHFSLALVNKACKYSIYKVEPIAHMRSFDVTEMGSDDFPCECTERELKQVMAAIEGRLDVLKWLFEKGCPINAATLDGAATLYHWDTLQYLVDNKCPGWEKAAIKYAEHLRITPGDDE